MENKKTCLSIIVPVYNVEEKYLTRCIKSILNQRITSFEIILVDDGSKADIAALCDSFQTKYRQVKVVHQKNKGVSAARNYGIKNVKGKYLGFVDADDWIEPNFYEEMIKYAEKNELDIVVSGYVINRKEREFIPFEIGNPHIMNAMEARKCLLENAFFNWAIWDKIYNLSHMKTLSPFDETMAMGEDLDFFWKALWKCTRVGYLPLHQYHYFSRSDSAVNSKNPLKKLEVVKWFKDEIEKSIWSDQLQQRLIELYLKEIGSLCWSVLLSTNTDFKVEEWQQQVRLHVDVLRKNKDYPFGVKMAIYSLVLPLRACHLMAIIMRYFNLCKMKEQLWNVPERCSLHR